jgi:hypothetical protein
MTHTLEQKRTNVWNYAPALTPSERETMLNRHVSAPSLMRLTKVLSVISDKGLYISQPGSTLRGAWAIFDHPLDLLQASLDKLSYEGCIQLIRKYTGKQAMVVPGLDDVFLNHFFCRYWASLCASSLLKELCPLKSLLQTREREFYRTACRRWWVYILFKRRQEKEHSRLSEIMKSVNTEAEHKFKQRVLEMFLGWSRVARKAVQHYDWQIKLYRQSWKFQTWKSMVLTRKWPKINAVRLFTRVLKIFKRWCMVQTCRRFFIWKENSERVATNRYEDWRRGETRRLFFRWVRSAEKQKVARERVLYALANAPLQLDHPIDEQKYPTIENLEPSLLTNLRTMNTDLYGKEGVELANKARKRLNRKYFESWQRVVLKTNKKSLNAATMRADRQKSKKTLKHCHSCHGMRCAVSCPPSCTYLIEKKQMRVSWKFIKI